MRLARRLWAGTRAAANSRNMGVLRNDAADAVEAEPRAQSIDKMRKILGVVRAGEPDPGARRADSLTRTARRIMSKPKPGSYSSPRTASRSTNRRRIRAGPRIGAAVPTSSRTTLPSARNNESCSRRAPSPRFSRKAFSSAPASCSTVPSTSSSRAMGSGKRYSAMVTGKGCRGVIGSSSRPNAWSRRWISIMPKRAASGARGRHDIGNTAQARERKAVDGHGIETSAASGSDASAVRTPSRATTVPRP